VENTHSEHNLYHRKAGQMKVVVLGAGMVGGAIARDLAQDADMSVLSADRDAQALARLNEVARIDTAQADLREAASIQSLVADCDLVVSAVPGFMGHQVLRDVIIAGKNVVDISFFAEDPFSLDDLARSQGVTAVVDCGVAPGLCNIIAGRVHAQLDETESYQCYVGGLPLVRRRPFEYKAVFSPQDVLEEYTRPARFVERGREVVCPALSEVELLDFPEVGTLEAFNTDGLRTLAKTLPIPFMREKTMRYPGHADLMRIFRDSGFLSPEPMDVDGVSIAPLSLTSKLLFRSWHFEPGEVDLTIMQVILTGRHGGRAVTHTYDLLDRYDEATGVASMSRTTGYTCSLVARQVLRGQFAEPGICPPEFIGRTAGCYEDLLTGYAERGIHLKETITEEEPT